MFITLLIALTAAQQAAPPEPARAILDQLAGCWAGPGEVMGEANRSRARASWRLGGRYLLLELISEDGDETYQAAIVMAPAENAELRAFWMDTFGGAYSAAGSGQAEAAGFSISYPYPDAIFVNRFARDGDAWRWTIVQRPNSGQEKAFASYRLTRADCRGFPGTF